MLRNRMVAVVLAMACSMVIAISAEHVSDVGKSTWKQRRSDRVHGRQERRHNRRNRKETHHDESKVHNGNMAHHDDEMMDHHKEVEGSEGQGGHLFGNF